MGVRNARLWLILLVATVDAHAANIDTHIRTLASSCVICHGSLTTSTSVIPSLNGLDESYFIRQMKAYRNSPNENEVMVQHAKGLTEEEIHKLASYFAKQDRSCPALKNDLPKRRSK